MTILTTSLPANVKTGGIDLTALIKTPEDETLSYLTNTDVYGEVGVQVLASLILTDGVRVTLRGPITERRQFNVDPADATKGIDFEYVFEAKQLQLFDDEAVFEGFWSGVVRWSRFRWAVTELKPSTEQAYNDAQLSATALTKLTLSTSTEYLQTALKSLPTTPLTALDTLTLALRAADKEEESRASAPSSDDDEDDTDSPSPILLRIYSARIAASHALTAYASALRDATLVARLFGSPIDVLNNVEDKEAVEGYFRGLVRKGESAEKLGRRNVAAEAYLGVLTLSVVGEQNREMEEEGEDVEMVMPIDSKIAEQIAEEAAMKLKSMNYDTEKINVFRIRVDLEGVDVPVWRELEVTEDTHLAELREYIVLALGWSGVSGVADADGEGTDLAAKPGGGEWEVQDAGIVRFAEIPEDLFDESDYSDRLDACEDEAGVRVNDIFTSLDETVSFVYESGAWRHTVRLLSIREEKVEGCCSHDHNEEGLAMDGEEGHEHEHNHESKYPSVVGGSGACPPEELGGPEGYRSFLSLVSGSTSSTPKFPTKHAALSFASERIGFTNTALESWSGYKSRKLENSIAILMDTKPEEVKDEEEKEGEGEEKGGWDLGAFDLESVNRTLKAVAAMMEEEGEEDEWEDEEDEEGEDDE
ncbi:hypothetical protein HDV00_008130 [Rhizophlyctis rosea]|nr:hypothetical protein HDV00_008130 [Rhizophlyctis rosea]